jgi:hypothetical protein
MVGRPARRIGVIRAIIRAADLIGSTTGLAGATIDGGGARSFGLTMDSWTL